MTPRNERLILGGADRELEGWKVVTQNPIEDHDGDKAGRYVATFYDIDDAIRFCLLWNREVDKNVSGHH